MPPAVEATTPGMDGVASLNKRQKTKDSAEVAQPRISLSNINSNVIKAEYAVRGEIVAKAAEIEKDLANGAVWPFKKLVYCNIGNPQSLGQKPITFNRQVGALCDYPELRDQVPAGTFPSDVLERAESIMGEVQSTGAYSNSKGAMVCRELVAAGITERDGFPCDPESIFMTDGASPAVHGLLQLLIRCPKDGWLVPIPQYPLYSAGINLHGGTLIPYYLKEEQGWGLDPEELLSSLCKAKSEGVSTRAMVVINPGNPTGQCLSRENQTAIIRFCVATNVVLIADEVYQTNVYAEGKKFHSFRQVMHEMGNEAAGLQLISLHSISKGFMGECGRRGGYMHVEGLPDNVMEQILKLWSVNLCPNLSGQISMANQMQPPKPGQPSYQLFAKERDSVFESLKRRALTMHAALNKLEGVSCQPAEGAMYCFPTVSIPKGAVAEAKANGQSPDFLYCMECLKATGLVIVPGSGFRQVEGTFHFRTTFLPSEEDLEQVIGLLAEFHSNFMRKYSNLQ